MTSRLAALAMTVAVFGVAGCGAPTVRETAARDALERTGVFSVHCEAASGAAAREIVVTARVLDFGQGEEQLDFEWSHGDGNVQQSKVPRPRFPGGRPVRYRLEESRRHTYKDAGTYAITIRVRDARRIGTCEMTVAVPQTWEGIPLNRG